MKFKTAFLLLICVFTFCLTGCGEREGKCPVDCPGTKWTCLETDFTFAVSNEEAIIDACVVDNVGNMVEVSMFFSSMEESKLSVNSADGAITYFSGKCTYGNGKFDLTITDLYDSRFSNLPVLLHFNKK